MSRAKPIDIKAGEFAGFEGIAGEVPDMRLKVHPNWDNKTRKMPHEPSMSRTEVLDALYGSGMRDFEARRMQVAAMRPHRCDVCHLRYETEGEAFECCKKLIILNRTPTLTREEKHRANRMIKKGYTVKEIFGSCPTHYGLLTAYCSKVRRALIKEYGLTEKSWLPWRNQRREENGLPALRLDGVRLRTPRK